ncbi:MAG: hypothetical protein R3F61_36715 [Myxococcota bacterium]
MLPVLFRATVPPALARTMPGLIALLFAVSQVSAVVDIPALAHELQARSTLVRAAVAVGIALFGAASAGPILRPIVWSPRLAFVWRLPLTDARLLFGLLPALAVGALPAVALALLLGPVATIGIGATTALASAAWIARSPWAGVLVALSAATALPGGLLVGPLALVLAGRVGRALRNARPLGGGSPRTVWVRGGPVRALVQRDLLALWRTWPATVVAVPVAVFALTLFVQRALHASWSPAAIGTGSVIAVGVFGALPAVALGAIAHVERGAQLARVLPVGPIERVAALLCSGGLAIGPAVAGVIVGGTANGTLGGVRVVLLGFAFSALAVRTLVARDSQRGREDLVSHGIAASVFLTVIAAASPLGTFAVAGLGLAATASSWARLR